MMEEQVERCREEIRGVMEVKDKLEGVLRGLGKELNAVVGEGDRQVQVEDTRKDRKRAVERRVWDMIEREIGT